MSNLTENVANKKVQNYVKKSHITTENEPKSEKNTQDVQKNCSSLTKLWKSGGLKKNKKYYTTDKLGRSYIKTYNKKGFKGLVHEVIEEVPSYEEWKSLNELVDCMSDTGKAFAHMLSPFTDDYFNGLTTKDIAELAKKSIRLTTQHCEDNAEIDKLKELLKECRDVAEFTKTIVNKHKWFDEVITKIDEVLK